ncbi:MAG: LptA/OstA family protein [Micavibrio sp.]
MMPRTMLHTAHRPAPLSMASSPPRLFSGLPASRTAAAALAFAAALMVAAAPAQAQIAGNQEEPIEITATGTVEWLRGKQQYVARRDVIVTQGTMQLYTDLLTADYREGAASSTEIWQLTAEGNVQVKDQSHTAYGDHGVYDVESGVATLTGDNLRLVSPDQTVTARDKMEYFANERKARAIGNAVVTRPNDTIRADTITAFFKADSGGTLPNRSGGGGSGVGSNSRGGSSGGADSGNLNRLEAVGKVVITTPSEKLYGDRAVYKADTNMAEMTGNVRVERGPNVLEGVRAEVDLNTNISKMFGSGGEGGRVRGVFFPGSESKDGAKKPAKPDAAAPEATANPPAPQSLLPPSAAPGPSAPHAAPPTAPDGMPSAAPSAISAAAPAAPAASSAPSAGLAVAAPASRPAAPALSAPSTPPATDAAIPETGAALLAKPPAPLPLHTGQAPEIQEESASPAGPATGAANSPLPPDTAPARVSPHMEF